ncbi:HK97 family phage prohead protease [Bradyrhizobium sp. AZCC 1699]|uniref:HK97 family phage prohead protease n=1 Tax=Bradyrhizobium sp. AZCC 1699 TaxID=3117024 RepID=UPI002FF166EE
MTERLEIKSTLAVTDEGEIEGNAWVFAEPDQVGDIIVKGAINVVGSDLPLLFQHDPSDLVGSWSEIKQTDDGLIVKGRLHVDRPRARSVLAMVKSGLVSGLSIGFKAKSWTQQGRNRVIAALDLFEVSIVRNPSHPKARVLSAKESEFSADQIAVAESINCATAAQIIQRATAQIKGS